MKVRVLRDDEQLRFIVGAGYPVDTTKLERGSRRYECSACSGRMWLAPKGQSLVAKGAEPLCDNCFTARLAGGRVGPEVTATDEEAAAFFSRAFQTVGPKENTH